MEGTLPDTMVEGIRTVPELSRFPCPLLPYLQFGERNQTVRVLNVLNKTTSNDNVGGLRTNRAFRDRLMEE